MAERSLLTASDSQTPRWQAPVELCPYCPASLPGYFHQELLNMPVAQAIFSDIVSHPSGTVQTESRRRISRDRSRQKRGPPVQFRA